MVIRFDNIKNEILKFDKVKVNKLISEALQSGDDPVAMLDYIKDFLNDVGKDFQDEKIFLPELVGIADTIESPMALITGEIKKRNTVVHSLGKIAIGTVFGDIHTMGKVMVATLLAASGFQVIDIGINVAAEKFVEVVENEKIDILAMSALLTTTAPEQKKVIDMLKEKKIREQVKIMVGGGAITQEFANEIGADGYDPTAPGAVELAKRLLKVF